MESVKVLFRDKIINKDNKSPVRIRITANRNKKEITIANVHKKDWDPEKLRVRSSAPYSSSINESIREHLDRANKEIHTSSSENRAICIEKIFKKQNNKDDDRCLIKIFQDFIDDKTNASTHIKYRTYHRKVKAFLGDKFNIDLFDINYVYKYEKYLKVNCLNSTNTVTKNMKILSACFNYAIKRNIIKENPFRFYKFKQERINKIPLNKDELFSLESLEISDNYYLCLIRDSWVSSLYLRGMRISDVITLKKEYIKGDRLIYKTSKDKEVHDIKISQKVIEIFNKYSNSDGEYIFPFYKFKPTKGKAYMENEILRVQHIGSINAFVNKKLKQIAILAGISKRLTFHTARHTFSSLMDIGGARVTDIQRLLGHSSLAMTDTYLSDLRRANELDAIVDNVFK